MGYSGSVWWKENVYFKENTDLEQQQKSATFESTYENIYITVVWTAH